MKNTTLLFMSRILLINWLLITDYCYHYFATQVKCGMLFLGITLIIQRHYAIFIVTTNREWVSTDYKII